MCDTCDCPDLMVLLKADLARVSGEGRVAAATGNLGFSRLSTLEPIGVSHANSRSPPVVCCCLSQSGGDVDIN